MKNSKKFIITIVLMAAINTMAGMGWWYAFDMARKEKSGVERLRIDVSATEKRLNNARSLNNLLKNTEKDAEKISAVFLDSKNIVKFVEGLESLSRKSGVSLVIKSATLPGEKEAEKPKLSFRTKGSFRDLFQHLVLLENIPYQIRFDKVSFTRLEKENWQIDFEITILSYAPHENT